MFTLSTEEEETKTKLSYTRWSQKRNYLMHVLLYHFERGKCITGLSSIKYSAAKLLSHSKRRLDIDLASSILFRRSKRCIFWIQINCSNKGLDINLVCFVPLHGSTRCIFWIWNNRSDKGLGHQSSLTRSAPQEHAVRILDLE